MKNELTFDGGPLDGTTVDWAGTPPGHWRFVIAWLPTITDVDEYRYAFAAPVPKPPYPHERAHNYGLTDVAPAGGALTFAYRYEGKDDA